MATRTAVDPRECGRGPQPSEHWPATANAEDRPRDLGLAARDDHPGAIVAKLAPSLGVIGGDVRLNSFMGSPRSGGVRATSLRSAMNGSDAGRHATFVVR